jgi:hypothetical protein
MTQYEAQLATAIVEQKYPHLCEGNDHDPLEKENLATKVLKTSENRKTAKRSWKKLGRHIRGVLKPETLERIILVKIGVPNGDGWRSVEDK